MILVAQGLLGKPNSQRTWGQEHCGEKEDPLSPHIPTEGSKSRPEPKTWEAHYWRTGAKTGNKPAQNYRQEMARSFQMESEQRQVGAAPPQEMVGQEAQS